MLVATITDAVLFCVSFGTLVIGQPKREGWLTETKTSMRANEYIDEFRIQLTQTNDDTLISASINVKKALPADLNLWWSVTYNGERTAKRDTRLCNYLTDVDIGPILRAIILPENQFPAACPVVSGNWSVSKWAPFWTKLDRLDFADGPFQGKMRIYLEGKPDYVQVAFSGVLSETFP